MLCNNISKVIKTLSPIGYCETYFNIFSEIYINTNIKSLINRPIYTLMPTKILRSKGIDHLILIHPKNVLPSKDINLS